MLKAGQDALYDVPVERVIEMGSADLVAVYTAMRSLESARRGRGPRATGPAGPKEQTGSL